MTTLRSTSPSASVTLAARPTARGKFVFAGDEKFFVRGVTYGTFRPNDDGEPYPRPQVVEQDFALMEANGINAIRTYTVPPRWLLDAAQRHGLRVMVGLHWEQHVFFLDDKKSAPVIEERVRAGVRACVGHPAILCYAIGNEIPAPIVRWHGRRRVERFLERLYRAAKAEDPSALFTYANYPTTEYLDLSFLDIVCFNVYLESPERFDAYLARLQNIAGDRPLIMAEIGLDSRRNGEEGQMRSVQWQVRKTFAAGCAGAFVYAWTDEWHAGGNDIEDWDFGLTGRYRRPKPALAAVREAYREVPFPRGLPWPHISVVVCSYNGERTIRGCFEGLLKLEYPNFEVIVVDDGSTDATAAIAREYGFRLISTENRGLSSARNAGLEAAAGEMVAYIDDDARPDSHWLTYLAATFLDSSHAGVGGPNIAPPGDGHIADCVANAPGGPIHVLLSDREAEHIPGCNMAFRKASLTAIGGFDPRFRIAGDDVDVCWRLRQQGWTLGFSPAAVVWHHRRNSLRAYWKQQQGYGKAEALLESKWPDKYNAAGHLTWAGRLYGSGMTQTLALPPDRIYQGTWGSAAFQSVYQAQPGLIRALPLLPEWYLAILVLAALSALGALWSPLLLALPLLGLAVAVPLVQAGLSAARAFPRTAPYSPVVRLKLRLITAFLHLLQPAARLSGRLRNGLTPWRRRGTAALSCPYPRTFTIWSERGQAADERLRSIELALKGDGSPALRGGDYDDWDLEVRGGLLGSVRARMAIEEHGPDRQRVRFRLWPRCPSAALGLSLLFAALSSWAGFDHAWFASSILGAVAALLALRTLQECAAATGAVLAAIEQSLTGSPHFKITERLDGSRGADD